MIFKAGITTNFVKKEKSRSLNTLIIKLKFFYLLFKNFQYPLFLSEKII